VVQTDERGRIGAFQTEMTTFAAAFRLDQAVITQPAPARTRPQATELLAAWRHGDQSALDQLVPLVEGELRRLARGYLRRERPGHVLQTTALVNEAFVRLLNWQDVNWQNRAHFVAMAARLMRNVLVDIARRRAKGADGRSVRVVDAAAAESVAHERARDVMALDDALCGLAEHDHRKAQIVELRFFGGLSLEEIAEVIGVAPITVSREWAKARAWLHREVTREPDAARRR
jgi:RNA polymerase sigma-70 factor (ECF subfamily)